MCIVLADTSGPQLIASRIKVCRTYLYKDPAQQLAIFVRLSVIGPPHPRGPILDWPLYRIRRDEKSRQLTISYHPFIVPAIAYTVPTR